MGNINKKRKNNVLPFILVGIGIIATLFAMIFLVLNDKTSSEADETEMYAEIESESENSSLQSENTHTEGENAELTGKQSESEGRGDRSETLGDDAGETENTTDSSEEDTGETENTTDSSEEDTGETENTTDSSAENTGETEDASDTLQKETEETEIPTEVPEEDNGKTDDTSDAIEEVSEAADAGSVQSTASAVTGGHLVVIDPGHQTKGNSDTEPNGPGSSTMKAKVTGGTSGATSGLTEYQLNLTVGLKLRDELAGRGYTVIMTRESNDVDISNSERAQIANNAGAEAFIRIHANGSEDTSVNGAMTICQTPSNPYNSAYYSQSRKLSDCVLDAFVAATGCKKQYVWETDTMTGINWANVPSTIIEMGYMTNPTEDSNMASESYQQLMVQGMANGIDNFFSD